MTPTFSISMTPLEHQFINHSNGSISVSVINGSNFVHLHFATPIEAWQWHSKIAYELEQKMTAEVQNEHS